MEIETPYNHPEIIYEITDKKDFISTFIKICHKQIELNENLPSLMKFNKEKYTMEFFKTFFEFSDILITMNVYLSKAENGNYLINVALYRQLVKEHIQHVYGKILNMIVDDGYLTLCFNSETEKFVWLTPKKKERKK